MLELGHVGVLFYMTCSVSPIVGNKDDDPSRKHVETADAKRFSEQMGVRLYETSAKENRNVEEVRVERCLLCLYLLLGSSTN